MILGMTLQTTPAEIYRALVEACAFGCRVIMERLEESTGGINRVVSCGGIANRNPMVMQIYADVTGRPWHLAGSRQTCALGAAMTGAVLAGAEAGGHESFAEASESMAGVRDECYEPDEDAVAVYDRLYRLYRCLHDAFGTDKGCDRSAEVMKKLLSLRDEVRGSETRIMESPEKEAHGQ
jgi:L-ribulokinase